MKNPVQKEERIRKINEAIAAGFIGAREISEITDINEDIIYRYSSKGLIRLKAVNTDDNPEGFIYGTRRDPQKDRLINEGLSLVRIAEDFCVTGEAIRQYIVRTGQHDLWEEKKEFYKINIKNERVSILELINQRIDLLVNKETWSRRKALEYKLKTINNTRSLPLEKLVQLFERYEAAKDEDKKLSLEELSEGLMSIKGASKILRAVGLEPCYGSIERSGPITRYKLEAIERAYSEMSDGDIAYFLGLKYYNVRQFRLRKGLKRKFQKPVYSIIPREGLFLTYRLTSQIYEAAESGFTREETTELLDIDIRQTNFALIKRSEIEPRLIDKLRPLYNSALINKPYKINF